MRTLGYWLALSGLLIIVAGVQIAAGQPVLGPAVIAVGVLVSVAGLSRALKGAGSSEGM